MVILPKIFLLPIQLLLALFALVTEVDIQKECESPVLAMLGLERRVLDTS